MISAANSSVSYLAVKNDISLLKLKAGKLLSVCVWEAERGTDRRLEREKGHVMEYR